MPRSENGAGGRSRAVAKADHRLRPGDGRSGRRSRPAWGPSDPARWSAVLVLLVGAGFALPSAVRGQVLWDAPRLIGPDSPGGLGVYWLRANALVDDQNGAMGTWAFPGTDGRVILRGGAAVDPDDRVSAFGGIDLRTPLARHTESQPLDLEWYAGAGAGGGAQSEQHLVISVPMGISAGRSWTSGSVWLAPYVAAGLALDVHIGDDAPDDEFEVSPAVDIGVDLALDAARRFIIRAGASMGDRQAVAVGLTVGGGA